MKIYRKKTEIIDFFQSVILNEFYWLGKGSLFQTFDDLDSIIDKETEIKEIRQVLDEDTVDKEED